MVFHKLRFFPPCIFNSLFIGGSQISGCLGVNLDPSSKFKSHVQSCFYHLQIVYVLNEMCLKVLYYSVIYHNNIYCASAWSGTFNSLFDPAFIVQKGATWRKCWIDRRTPSQGLFEELGLLKLTEVLKCVTVVYAYRSLVNPC